MNLSKENNAKYIYLIVYILIQLIGFSNCVEPILCVACGGANTKCSDNLSEKPEKCLDDTYKKCYTEIDANGSIIRGCRKAGEESTCKPENNCILTEPEKNNQLICKKCEGSDEKCSQTDMNVNDVKYNEICNADTKKCLVKVDNKHVVRGCASASDVTQCTNANTCKTCEGVNCNTGIFPEGRLNCYQCNGSNCSDVAASGVVSKPCGIYEEKDECYTKGENDSSMFRGCRSDTKDNKCSSSAEGCAFCSNNSCNNLKYKRVQQLKCHQCTNINSTSNGDCYQEQTDQNYKNCEKEILYNEQEYCYTLVEGGIVERGCLHDNVALTIDKCGDGDSNVCSKCNQTNGCNSQRIEFTCIICRSDTDNKCWNEADKLHGQKCRGESTFADGCFQGIWNGVAIRGCVVDASVQNQEVCKDPKDPQCTVCNKKNCNTKRSSATKIGLSCNLILIVFITLWKFK